MVRALLLLSDAGLEADGVHKFVSGDESLTICGYWVSRVDGRTRKTRELGQANGSELLVVCTLSSRCVDVRYTRRLPSTAMFFAVPPMSQ